VISLFYSQCALFLNLFKYSLSTILIMKCETSGYLRKMNTYESWPVLRYYVSTLLEGLRKTTKHPHPVCPVSTSVFEPGTSPSLTTSDRDLLSGRNFVLRWRSVMWVL
jgi:hypothetical protein